MCIICIKKKGIKFPTSAQVKNMCDRNGDGFSLVLQSKKNKPSIYKTMNKKKFISFYNKIVNDYNAADTAMFIHARIKTHGTQRIENCHGWKENGLIFAHNGILSITNREDLTDSETFFRDIFSPAYKIGGWSLAKRTIDAIIGTSKFVFMDDFGQIFEFGQYIEDDGLLFSNSTYKSWEPTYFARWDRQLKQQGIGGFYPRTRSCADDWNKDFLCQEDDLVF